MYTYIYTCMSKMGGEYEIKGFWFVGGKNKDMSCFLKLHQDNICVASGIMVNSWNSQEYYIIEIKEEEASR